MEFSYDDDLIAFRDELRAFIAEHRTAALMEELREARRDGLAEDATAHVERLFVVSIEIADEQTERAVRIPEPPFVRGGNVLPFLFTRLERELPTRYEWADADENQSNNNNVAGQHYRACRAHRVYGSGWSSVASPTSAALFLSSASKSSRNHCHSRRSTPVTKN